MRHYGETARIEIGVDELGSARSSSGRRSSTAIHAVGYRYVTLDLEGFRSGNLNR